MSVGQYAIAEYATAESLESLPCDLGEALQWNALEVTAADLIFTAVGERGCYQQANGLIKNTRVIVDQALALIPDGFETTVGETKYSISLLKSEIPEPRRGDLVKTAAGIYQVEDLTADGDIAEWVVTARKSQ